MSMSRVSRVSVSVILLWGFLAVVPGETAGVKTQRLPSGGVQPQAVVDAEGVVHVIYLAGDPMQADVYYIRSTDWGRSFSEPVRVNSQAGSAVAAGTIRGAQIAVGGGRVHVAWNGSSIASPKGPLNPAVPSDSPHNGLPMLYSRLGTNGSFEPQRNLMTKTFGLDGGGSVAADTDGHVYVAWHGKDQGSPDGEGGRRVWLTRSTDDGDSFAEEQATFDEPTGACGCCGMRIFVDSGGDLLALYRSAGDVVHRDIYLLRSKDAGESFQGKLLHEWEIGACPMSSMVLAEQGGALLAGWETAQQVYWAKIDAGSLRTSSPINPSGEADNRKHPVLARNSAGDTLLAWITAGGWGKPGKLSWQVFDSLGAPIGDQGGGEEIPAWSMAAVLARADGGFTIVY